MTDAALLAARCGQRRQRGAGSRPAVTFSINNVSLTLDDGTPGPTRSSTRYGQRDRRRGHGGDDTDTATINVDAVAPAIMVVKTADPTKVNEGGQSVTYTYEVTNTSPSSTDPLTLTAWSTTAARRRRR